MQIVTDSFRLSTRGDADVIDITSRVQSTVVEHRMREGHALIFMPGSTAALTTIEYEPGLLEDLPAAFERIAPRAADYSHHEQWQDGNGHSHVRASLLGPSLTVPFKDGRLLLGTWQQIVLVDFDNRARDRSVIVQLTGFSSGDGQT